MRAAVLSVIACMLAACSGSEPPPTVRPWDCGTPEPYSVDVSGTHWEMCVGDEQRLSAQVHWSCGAQTTNDDAVFASSDPLVLSVAGDRAQARGTGAAEITATAEGVRSLPMVVRVIRCADAGGVSSPDAAADGADAPPGDVGTDGG